MKAHGRTGGCRFSTLRGGHIVPMCRKFESFGDLYLVTNPRFTWRLLRQKQAGRRPLLLRFRTL